MSKPNSVSVRLQYDAYEKLCRIADARKWSLATALAEAVRNYPMPKK